MPAAQKYTKSIRLDATQLEVLERLTPFYGSTPAEVIRNILLMWLHDNIGSDTLKELEKMGIVKLKKQDKK